METAQATLYGTNQPESKLQKSCRQQKHTAQKFKDTDLQRKKCVSASVQNQATVVKAIMEATSNAGGCGVFYWGGDWIPNSKIQDTWENQTLFDLEGKALESLNVFLTE